MHSSPIASEQVILDLDKETYVEENIYDSEGDYQGTITIEKSPSIEPLTDIGPIRYRGYVEISYTAPLGKRMSYNISISPNPNRITEARDPSYHINLATVDRHTLTYNGPTARLTLFCKGSGIIERSWTEILETELVNSRIIVIKK